MIQIRPATREDIPALGRLGALLLQVHYGFDQARFLKPGAHSEEGYGWFLGTQTEDKDAVVLVAEDDGRVVGYVWGTLEPLSWKELRGPAGFIQDVVVDESARGQGIGARLVEAAIKALEEKGAPRVMLWTADANASAQRLFARLGFRKTMIEMTRERGDGGKG